jgi:hypothetical protein
MQLCRRTGDSRPPRRVHLNRVVPLARVRSSDCPALAEFSPSACSCRVTVLKVMDTETGTGRSAGSAGFDTHVRIPCPLRWASQTLQPQLSASASTPTVKPTLAPGGAQVWQRLRCLPNRRPQTSQAKPKPPRGTPTSGGPPEIKSKNNPTTRSAQLHAIAAEPRRTAHRRGHE